MNNHGIEKVVSGSRAVVCAFCGHSYIEPCNAEKQAACPNMIAKREFLGAPAQASIRHHYIPEFYSKRWCSEDDRKLCEYSRPYKKIQSKRVLPVQTGFMNRLYEKKGVPKQIAQQVEDEFMSPVDNFAANALKLIETDFEKINTDTKHRSAWSLFLMTLMMRMPEDLVVLSQILEDDWKRELPVLRQKYATNRQTDDPETLQEFIEKRDPNYMARWTMNLLPVLIDHEGVRQSLNAMRWFVVTTPEDIPPFLSSDRPLFLSQTFSEPECFLTLPIGPRRLFVAANNEKTELAFREQQPNELVQATNLQVVKQSVKYVYSVDEAELEFVEKHVANDRPQTLMQKVQDLRKQKSALPEGKT